MGSLSGVGVLVTRPALQAAPLCKLLEAEGATTIRFAALEIDPIGNRDDLLSWLEPVGHFDLVIFTSTNSVHFGASLLDAGSPPPLGAIGLATARALTARGLGVAVMPVDGFDTEHLLRHPSLVCPTGQRILLIKGRHGRELLQEELTRRGADVRVAEVYARRRTQYGAAELEELAAALTAGGTAVVTATSVDVVAALMELPAPRLQTGLKRLAWLVPGARVAAAVHAHGAAIQLIRADSAHDHDLLSAIKRWRSSVSDA